MSADKQHNPLIFHGYNDEDMTYATGNTNFAEIASLFVFRLLNMVLWLGGTLSAKASQSMDFTAVRLTAMFQGLLTRGGRKTFRFIHSQTMLIS